MPGPVHFALRTGYSSTRPIRNSQHTSHIVLKLRSHKQCFFAKLAKLVCYRKICWCELNYMVKFHWLIYRAMLSELSKMCSCKWGRVWQRRMKSLTCGQSTAQTFTTMRLREGGPTVLDCPQIPDEEHHPILREELEAAVKALKMGKSAGVDNKPAGLVQAGGEAMIDILTTICNKIWKTGEWPTTWTQSLVITHSQRKASCSCARTTEPSPLSAITVRSCWRSS